MDAAEVRERYGRVFDGMAEEYDRERRTYPDEIVDAACADAGLSAGDRVLEVGCGTGKLTAALVRRGLHVDAVEPGENLIALARRRAGEAIPGGGGPGAATFQQAAFEDAEVGPGAYGAVFSASAFHWVDPDVSWRRAAEALRPGGRLCLIQYCASDTEETAPCTRMLLDALATAAPDVAANWPETRDAATIMEGVKDRRANVSAVWSWIGRYELERDEAAALFDDVRMAALPTIVEQTAEQLNARFRTTSIYARLGPERAAILERENRRVGEAFGGVIRDAELAVLVSARRI